MSDAGATVSNGRAYSSVGGPHPQRLGCLRGALRSAVTFVLRSQVLEAYDIDSSRRLELTEFNTLVMQVRAAAAANEASSY